MRKFISGLMLLLLLIGVLIPAFSIQSIRAEPRTWIVDDDRPADFNKIQDAVNAAISGDMILVRAGIYIENVNINKNHLTIRSESGAEATIVQAANPNNDVFDVMESYTSVSGFTAKGALGLSSSGIKINAIKSYNTIFNNIISQDYHGIVMVSHNDNNIIANNTVSFNNRTGISLTYSNYNVIRDNNISSNGYRAAEFFVGCNNNTIAGNRISFNQEGIYLSSSDNNTIFGNNIFSNTNDGVQLLSSSRNDLANNIVANNSIGIDIKQSSVYNDVSDNSVSSNGGGIILSGVTNVPIGNFIGKNTISNCSSGINVIMSANNTVDNNIVIDSGFGIMLTYANNTQLTNNTIYKSKNRGISVEGAQKSEFDNLIDISNTVNGKPVYYFFDKSDRVITGLDTTHLTMAYCSNFTIRSSSVSNGDGVYLWQSNNCEFSVNNIFANKVDGIYLELSSNNSIAENTISSNLGEGIHFWMSDNNQIYGNTISNNKDGIFLWDYCDENDIISNRVFSNAEIGIYLRWSSKNGIVNNDIFLNHDFGIYLFSGSTSNLIFLNNFRYNTRNAADYSERINFWDGTYSFGGNYWSDYNGFDLYSGTYQNEIGSDGIGDTPYMIEHANLDHYPLITWNMTLTLEEVSAWYWVSNTNINSVVLGDVDKDGSTEIVSAGYYYDGARDVAQLVVWDSSSLLFERLATWYWTGNTTINSVALGDVDGDGQIEIVTGGYYYDGSRNVAQLVVWNGLNLVVERLTTWYWTGNTVINSVAIANVDGDSQIEIVTGGYYNDGVRNIAQLVVWNGSNLAVDRLTTWYWTGNTEINSVALGDVDNDAIVEVVTGGYYNDGVRNIAQLIEWNGANLAVDRLTGWYWTGNTVINSVAVGDADNDGQTEVVTGGYYNDGVRNIAQLIEWNGVNLAVDRLTTWYWTSNTVMISVALGDVDGDGQTEVVTGGYYNDGTRNVSQLTIWSGSSLAAENIKTWYWTSNTTINSIAVGDVNGDFSNEIVTGGAFYDGTRLNSQLTVWGMT